MNRSAALLLSLTLLINLPAALAGDLPLTTEDVTVDYKNDRYSGQFSLQVNVPPSLAIDVLTDFEHMADFIPNLESSRIDSRNGNVYLIAQRGKADFGPLSFHFESERRVELFADGRLVSQAISGSTKYLRSELRVQPVGGGSRIDYHIEMTPDHWIPSGVGTHFLRHELTEQFNAIAGEMKRRQALRQAR